MSDIFTEVDEEVRREQLKKLWERYGNYAVAAAFLVVAAVAAWRGYDYWQTRRAAEAGAAYDAAARLAEEGNHGEAEAAFAKLVTEGTAGYRLLARLREAAEISERDPKAAVAAYDQIAGETTGQPLISELAAVRAAFLLVDTAKLDEMTQRLEPLAGPSGVFRHTARELLALAAWRNHDTAAMRRWTVAAKNDPEAPSGVRSRMDVLASLLPEAGKP
ncbi:MAG TPA: tetratricopeptide repeat protein [Xanthobacteraceae bacterium]|nr:tetratricopeptide repeat protein [Xanthobacteraceae bacterium]